MYERERERERETERQRQRQRETDRQTELDTHVQAKIVIRNIWIGRGVRRKSFKRKGRYNIRKPG